MNGCYNIGPGGGALNQWPGQTAPFGKRLVRGASCSTTCPVQLPCSGGLFPEGLGCSGCVSDLPDRGQSEAGHILPVSPPDRG